MSFLSKFLHKSNNKSISVDTLPREGVKHNTHKPTSHKSKSKSKKAYEKELTIKKVNLCKVYNRDENYKPVNSSNHDPFTGYENLYSRSIPKFKNIIEEDVIVNMEALQKLAWQGVPVEQRPMVWKILLNYVPVNKASREATIGRKREEYASFIQMYCVDLKEQDLDESERKAFKVVKDDVHRTQPDYPIFHHTLIQDLMTRLLWIWHVRHPASGYVQGINDLITPFLAVFLKEHISNIDFNTFDIPEDFEENLTQEVIAQAEADTYWCVSKILEGILDNYTFSHIGGTHKALDRIKEITRRIDPELFKYLQKRGVDFTFFSFRWIFCLLVREFPLKVGMRLFDTYIADDQGFSILHAYVCATLLMKWSVKLKKMSFTDIMVFLQNMPTKDWSEQDLEMLVSEAYVFKTLYEGSFNCVTSPSVCDQERLPTGPQTDRLT